VSWLSYSFLCPAAVGKGKLLTLQSAPGVQKEKEKSKPSPFRPSSPRNRKLVLCPLRAKSHRVELWGTAHALSPVEELLDGTNFRMGLEFQFSSELMRLN